MVVSLLREGLSNRISRLWLYTGIFFILTVPLDYVSTLYGLGNSMAYESNPIVNFAMEHGIFLEYMIVGGALFVVCSAVLINMLEQSDDKRAGQFVEGMLLFLCIAMAIIVINNVLIGLEAEWYTQLFDMLWEL